MVIRGTAADYTVKYDPPEVDAYKLRYEQRITVRANASDLAGNSMATQSYSFTTAMIIRGPNIKASKRR